MQIDTFRVSSTITGRKGIMARAAVRGLAWHINAYQPVMLDGKVIAAASRDHDHRLALVLSELKRTGVKSATDLGCAEGYFVRRMAEAGYLAIGVEADARMLALAQWSLTLDGVEGFGFVRMLLDAESVARLPESDATVCLSLMHHILLAQGRERTVAMLEAIRQRTRKLLLFEMGQSNETGYSWAIRLPDMGGDPYGWITELLEDAGWQNVELIGETAGPQTEVLRGLFSAVP